MFSPMQHYSDPPGNHMPPTYMFDSWVWTYDSFGHNIIIMIYNSKCFFSEEVWQDKTFN